MQTDNAILLRKVKLTETSLIVSWMSEQHGKIKTVAKGARRTKSAFAGRLDLFFDCVIHFRHNPQHELHTLREVVVQNSREGVRRSYAKTCAAAYFVELVELATEFEQRVPEIYDLLKRGLNYIADKELNRRAILHFESELSRLLGLTGPHNSQADPAMAIARLIGKLPPERAALLKQMTAV